MPVHNNMFTTHCLPIDNLVNLYHRTHGNLQEMLEMLTNLNENNSHLLTTEIFSSKNKYLMLSDTCKHVYVECITSKNVLINYKLLDSSCILCVHWKLNLQFTFIHISKKKYEKIMGQNCWSIKKHHNITSNGHKTTKISLRNVATNLLAFSFENNL